MPPTLNPTLRQAARAARQLYYHRSIYSWITERMADNEALLERLLIEADADRLALPGGYALYRADNALVVERHAGAHGYEQLRLPTDSKGAAA